MGTVIIKLADHYLEWSSIVDAPVTFGMTLEELNEHVREELGAEGLRRLPARLERVERQGHSGFHGEGVDGIIWLNRAGPGETPLSKAEIVEWFVRRRKNPTKAEIDERRASLPKCDPCTYIDGMSTCGCWGTGVIDGDR
ncbi:MAG TPA: hypothetical protein VF765_31185 [Polyangiaceae bacterium]